ncbi:MAG: SCO family protein [Pseudomonadota bacterium]
MPRLVAPIAVVIALAFVGAIWFVTQRGSAGGQFAQCQGGVVAGDGNTIGGPFELVNARGETVNDQDVITEASLIYFGFTFCPDVCHMDNARNADAVDILAEQGLSATPVFISIDPERDTPEVMGEYTSYVHDKMIGLTGSLEQTDAASKAYRTYYRKQDSDDPEFYNIDHSTFTYLVLPEHGFVEFFRRDTSPDDMAARTACFIENA